MTEKLKYKAGDKVLIEAEVDEVDSTSEYQYGLTYSKTGDFIRWVTEDKLDKVSVTNPPKPKVTQELMNWYENSGKELDLDLFDLFTDFEKGHYIPSTVYRWLADGKTIKENQKRQYALATLFLHGPEAVEVEKEKRYLVTLKSTGQLLARTADGFFFGTNDPYFKDSQYEFTKQEIIKAGFGDVFDNPMFEVEEVE